MTLQHGSRLSQHSFCLPSQSTCAYRHFLHLFVFATCTYCKVLAMQNPARSPCQRHCQTFTCKSAPTSPIASLHCENNLYLNMPLLHPQMLAYLSSASCLLYRSHFMDNTKKKASFSASLLIFFVWTAVFTSNFAQYVNIVKTQKLWCRHAERKDIQMVDEVAQCALKEGNDSTQEMFASS